MSNMKKFKIFLKFSHAFFGSKMIYKNVNNLDPTATLQLSLGKNFKIMQF